MDDLIAWLRAQLDIDEQAARACAEVYPPPWDVSDRGHTAEVKADEPDFRRVAELQQDPAIDGWLSERLDHIARWDPARVLAEIAAKRRIIELHQPVLVDIPALNRRVCPTCDANPCLTLRLLALPYADRLGYREEWRSVD